MLRCTQARFSINPDTIRITGSLSNFVSYRYSSFDSYQYLQKSAIPSQKFQKSLPRLAIPKLENTCRRYLEALKPIIASSDQLAKTEAIVKRFQTGEGPNLHHQLVQQDKANKHTSYISGPWFDYYLKSRLPLPLNFNPFMAWKDDLRTEYNHPALKATNFIAAAMRFRRSLNENLLEPEVFHLNPKKSDTEKYRKVMRWAPNSIATYVSFAFKAFPLDMSQYQNLFASTRIPRKVRDELVTYPNSKHVAVLRNGQFYIFDVLDANGNLKQPQEILANMQEIINAPTSNDKNSITVMTTENRDVWSDFREKLITNSQNKQNLELVDSAQFVICLDDLEFSPGTPEEDRQSTLKGAHNFLHGCAPGSDLVNRWFDKSFSILFTKCARASINFEHSWGDGVAVLRFFNEVYKDAVLNHHVGLDALKSKSNSVVRKLEFQLDNYCQNAIKEAIKKYHETTESLQLDMMQYNRMDRNYFKRKKLSPDSMFQLGFQIAYYRLFNGPATTYESCSTAAFRHGRTETLRSATMQTRNAALAILKDGSKDPQAIRKLLDECSKQHFQLSKEASMGQGFDRHLFALKVLAEKSGKLPEIYTDKSYTDACHFTLSTSTLYGEAFAGGGFSPVVPDGYGLGYGYVDNTLGVLVSTYHPHRNSTQFAQAVQASLDDIYEVLEKCN